MAPQEVQPMLDMQHRSRPWHPRKSAACLALLIVVALALAACSPPAGRAPAAGPTPAAGAQATAASNAAPSGDTINVGVVVPLSGRLAGSGELVLRGYRLAIDQANRDGGVNGKKIELAVEDDRSDPTTAANATEKLITQDSVVAILGSYGTAASVTSSDVAEKHHIPNLVGHCSEARCATRNTRYFFDINSGGPAREQVVSDFVSEVLKPETVSLVHTSDAWTKEGTDTVARALSGNGITIKDNEEFPAAAPDISAQLTKIKASNAGTVVVYAYDTDLATFMRQIQELAINPKYLLFPADLTTSRAAAGIDFNSVLMADEWFLGFPGEENARYEKLYRETYPDDVPDRFAVKAYVAAEVLLDALRRAGTAAPEAVRDALAATNIQTPMGETRFNSDGQRIGTNVVYQVQDGKPVILFPANRADQGARLQTWRGFL
jgi:branched-chain amino acid transport system substrate-binding protein